MIAVLALVKAILLLLFLPKIKVNTERMPVWRQMPILREPRLLGHILLSLLMFEDVHRLHLPGRHPRKGGGFSGAAVGWILMGFGGVGLLGNWLGGRFVDRHPLRASVLFCVPLARERLLPKTNFLAKIYAGPGLIFIKQVARNRSNRQ